tara:strand:- start:285 stop:407 length:123 start_codon:yes stop_codon:yes gene_type:complete
VICQPGVRAGLGLVAGFTPSAVVEEHFLMADFDLKLVRLR